MIKKILIFLLIISVSLFNVFADNTNNRDLISLANDANSDVQFFDTSTDTVSFDDTYNIVKDINFSDETYLYTIQGELENPSSFTTVYLRQTYYYADGTNSSQEDSLANAGSPVFQNFTFTNPNYLSLDVERITWEIKSDVSGIVRLRNKIYNKKSNVFFEPNYYNSNSFVLDYTQHNSTDNMNLFSYIFSGESLDRDNTSWINFKSDNTITRNDGTLNGFTFNDGTLTNFADTTRNGARVTGDINGATWNGDVLEFDGVDDFVQLDNNANFDLSNNFTMSFWANRDSFNVGAGIIDKLTASPNYEFRLFEQTADVLRVQLSSDGTSLSTIDASSSCNLVNNEWVHITFTFNNGNINWYKNGGLCDSDTSTVTKIHKGNSNLVLGKRQFSVVEYNGSLSQFRLYNFAVNTSQVTQLYNNESLDLEAHQVSHVYRLDEGEGVKAYDTGTTGKFGNYLTFDGTDDYISANLNQAVDTACVWAKNRLGSDQYYYLTNNAQDQIWGVRTDNNLNIYESGWKSFVYSPSKNWEYHCIVYETDHYDLYVNGAYEASAAVSNKIVVDAISGTTTNSMQGSLKHFRVWDYKLNSSQIQAEMNSENPVLTPVASYSFSEDKGTTAFDTNAWVQGNTTDEVFNKALSFDGVDDYVDLGSTTQAQTYNFMFKPTNQSNGGSQYVFFLGSNYFYFRDSNSDYRFNIRNSVGTSFTSIIPYSQIIENTWYNMTLSIDWDNLVMKTYIDSINYNNITLSGSADTTTRNLDIGSASGTSFFEGSLDNVRIYNVSLTPEQISNENTSNLVWASSFEQVDNLEVYDRNDQICYNCSSVSLTTDSPTDGIYTQWLEDSQTGFQNFAILYFDTENPTYVNNIPVELDDRNRTIDFTSFLTIDYGLSGKESCTITFSSLETSDCSNSSFNFDNAGNFTYTIEIEDKAGNTNSTAGSIYVNPLQYFKFLDVNTGDPITNFYFNGLLYTGEAAEIPLFDIGLGSFSWLFNKSGYFDTNINFTTALDSELNITTSINVATITVNVYDRESFSLISGSTTTLTLIGTAGDQTNTTTGIANLTSTSFAEEVYQVLASNPLYLTESVFFNYNNRENIEVNLFLLNATSPDAGTIKLIVKDDVSQFIQGATCSALEWRPTLSSFVTVASGTTNVNGEVILNIEIATKSYKFSCTKAGVTTVTDQQIIQTDASELTIILSDTALAPTPLLENVVFSFTNSTINATHQRLNFTFADTDNLITSGCIKLFKKSGNLETFINDVCVSSSTASIITDVNINNSFILLAKATVSTSAVSDQILSSIVFAGLQDIQFSLAKYHLDIFIPTILIILAITLGILTSNINLGIILMPVFSFAGAVFVPTILSGTITIVIAIISVLILWGGFNRK